MNLRTATFLTSAPDLASCPPPDQPEFAFIGRSNVGKSSLLNLLTGRKDLARVSGSPGHTKLVNFFGVDNRWRLVDLPGYGYAKGSKQERERFQEMIAEYLSGRMNLACLFILIDSRHPPQAIDLDFVAWVIEGGIPFRLVFTKTDKVKAGQLKKNIAAFQAGFPGGGEWEVLSCSAKTGEGKGRILAAIAAVLA